MALFKRHKEPSDLDSWRDQLKEAAKAERERHMKFRVREGFEQGFTAGDVRGKTGEIVHCTPERGQQLKNWLEPAEPFPWETKSAEASGEEAPDKGEADPPGAPPVVNAALSGSSETAGGKGRAKLKDKE